MLHLVCTSVYTRSLPANWLWWGLQVVSAALMTSLGIWACQWRELRPIVFGGASRGAGANTNADADAEQQGGSSVGGIIRGVLGRGGGGDGDGDAYEMVGMKERADDAV